MTLNNLTVMLADLFCLEWQPGKCKDEHLANSKILMEDGKEVKAVSIVRNVNGIVAVRLLSDEGVV